MKLYNMEYILKVNFMLNLSNDLHSTDKTGYRVTLKKVQVNVTTRRANWEIGAISNSGHHLPKAKNISFPPCLGSTLLLHRPINRY